MARACSTGTSVNNKRCDVGVQSFDVSGTPFEHARGQSDMPAIRDYMETRFNVRNREVYVAGQTGKRALIVSVESRQPDTLLPNLFDELSASADRQFSKTRPGVLCVQFIDLTDAQIKRIDKDSDNVGPSYILQRTSEFLQSPKRAHVVSVVFRGRGEVDRVSGLRGNWLEADVQEQGHAFFVTNVWHPKSNDRQYAIFGSEVPPQRIVTP